MVPEFRGKNATVKMYKHILPVLSENGVEKIILEVMEQNVAAIKSYLNSGFKKTDNKDIFKLCNFWDWEPSWQHSTETVQQSSSYETFCAILNNVLVGYATVIPKTGRVAQFAVNTEYRKTGIGTSMFKSFSSTI